MKVAVIGAGIVGVTTAYELSALGHEVQVFERSGSAAELCSFANAGVSSPGYVTPWAKPGMASHVLMHLWQKHTPVRLHRPKLQELSWLWRWWRACNDKTFAINRERLLNLSQYSLTRMQTLRDTLHLDHEHSKGYLVLLRGERELKLVQPSLLVMREAGLNFKTITAQEARVIEPALNADTPMVQALHFPDDEVGNCRQFALLVKNEAESRGVTFHFNADVQPFSSAQPKWVRTSPTDKGAPFDAIVVCAGLASARLLRPLGLKIPLMAVHGYSISAAVREPLDAPKSGVMDERYKVAISRLGQRVRISGGAEISGDPNTHHTGSLQTLYKVLDDWFPGAARTQDNLQVWKGARPMLPEGPPLVGPTHIPGVWLNLGHGSSGWALSCGSAKALADQLSGRPPDIDMQGFAWGRTKT
jgi:D-amino-acid dehydrogenase